MTTSDSSAEDKISQQTQESESAVEDVKTAPESSAAGDEGEKGPKSMLDAVQAALKPGDGAAGSPAAEGGEGEGDAEQAAEADPVKADGEKPKPEGEAEEEELGDLTEDELRRYKPKTRRRMQQLLDKASALEGQIGDLKPKAEKLSEVVTFCQEAGLSSQEVDTLFQVGATMKSGDPEKALAMIQPYYDKLLEMTGRTIPADLKQKVETGHIAEEDAAEMARLRARNGLTEAQQRARQEAQGRERAEEQHKQTVTEVASAISKWEQTWSASDPDHKLKAARVSEKIRLAFADGERPKTPTEAVALAEKCKKAVEEEIKSYQPRKQAVRTVTGGASAVAAPPPKTMLEAISRAVG